MSALFQVKLCCFNFFWNWKQPLCFDLKNLCVVFTPSGLSWYLLKLKAATLLWFEKSLCCFYLVCAVMISSEIESSHSALIWEILCCCDLVFAGFIYSATWKILYVGGSLGGTGCCNCIYCVSALFPSVKMQGVTLILYCSSLFANHTCRFDTEILSCFLITSYDRKRVFFFVCVLFSGESACRSGFWRKRKAWG